MTALPPCPWQRSPRLREFASREEWLGARRIGASDVAKILGVSPHGTAWDVWRSLRGEKRDRSGLADKARGNRFEWMALKAYGMAHNRATQGLPPHALFVGSERWATATPDAFAFDAQLGQWGLVEAKTDRHAHGRWSEEDLQIERWSEDYATALPREYALQGYAQLWVLDAPWVDVACLTPFYELRTVRLLRDLEVEAALVGALRGWWVRHIEGGEPPPLDGSDAATRHLAAAHAQSNGLIRPATAEEVALAVQYEQWRTAEKLAEQERRRLGQILLAQVGDSKGLQIGERGRVLAVRQSGRARLDEAALLERHPEIDLDSFRVTGEPSVSIRISNLETSR